MSEEMVLYEKELTERGIPFEQEKAVPITYKDHYIDCNFRLDFLIADKVVVELKALEAVLPIHKAQLLTYLKLTDCKVGLLINFNVSLLKAGIQRLIN